MTREGTTMENVTLAQMDLNLLRVFEAVYEEGSASRAAIRLDLTQSAISVSLRKLRDLYQDPLFVSTGRGLEPTLYARQVMPFVSDSLNKIRDSLSLHSGRGGLFQGRTITIGMSDDFELALGDSLVNLAREILPGGRLRFRQTNTKFVSDMLLSREIDLAITAGGFGEDGLSHMAVGMGTYGCVVDPKHFKDDFSLESYVKHEHVLISYSGFYGVVDEVLSQLNLKRLVRVSTSHFAATPFFILGTDAITTLPRHCAKRLAEITRLAYHPCPVDYPTYPVELGWRTSVGKDPVIQRLIEALKTRLMLNL